MAIQPRSVLPQDPLGALGNEHRLLSGQRIAEESMSTSPMAAAESQLAGQLGEVQAKMQLQQWQEAEAQADPVSSGLPCSSQPLLAEQQEARDFVLCTTQRMLHAFVLLAAVLKCLLSSLGVQG